MDEGNPPAEATEYQNIQYVQLPLPRQQVKYSTWIDRLPSVDALTDDAIANQLSWPGLSTWELRRR
jgi:hypothetical protein